jgi:hypothetical protein
LREFLRNSRACSAQMHKHGHFCWTTAKHEASYDSSINLTMDGGSGRICLRNVDKKCHHEAFLPGTLPIFAHSGGSFGWIPSAQLGIQAPMPQSLWVETTVTTEAKRPHCGSPTSQLHLRLLPERFDASVLMKSIFFGKKNRIISHVWDNVVTFTTTLDTSPCLMINPSFPPCFITILDETTG